MLILHTNVLSEVLRPEPNEAILAWLEAQHREHLFTRRQKLWEAAVAIFDEDLEDKVLPFDSAAADRYPDIAVRRKNAGRPISQLDAMIAAIARAHQGRLATRNIKDFVDCGIDLIDPWSIA